MPLPTQGGRAVKMRNALKGLAREFKPSVPPTKGFSVYL